MVCPPRLLGGKNRLLFSLLKKTKLSLLLSSNKQCPGSLTCSALINYMENLQEAVINNSQFIDEEIEAPRH